MKISPLTAAVRFLNQVQEKADSGHDGRQKKNSQDQNERKKQDEAPYEVTAEKLNQAVEGFQSDSQAQANGLSASIEGTGPGLKVILKDVSGSIVRQFTGGEFLDLRENISKEGHAPGKILDQKL